MAARPFPFLRGILHPPFVQPGSRRNLIPDGEPRATLSDVPVDAPSIKPDPSDPLIGKRKRLGPISKFRHEHRRRRIAIQRPSVEVLASGSSTPFSVPRGCAESRADLNRVAAKSRSKIFEHLCQPASPI